MNWAIRVGHPQMEQWLHSVQHAPNLALISLKFGRPDTMCMVSSLFCSLYIIDLCISNQLICTFITDSNFSAEHMKSRSGEQDALLSAGQAFMANPDLYRKHLDSGKETNDVAFSLLYSSWPSSHISIAKYL